MPIYRQRVHFLRLINFLRTFNASAIKEIVPSIIEKESPILAYNVFSGSLGIRMSSGNDAVMKVSFSVSP